ncbi:hypothetical protein AWB79_02801 [Caballeronia hypogeia]|uniref:Uncharacterized protein n=1 Tax=Caballeronia hypogeia TaxID=1777140 RepID=A0A158AVD8_9BURK|nr:hypothetical protein AWB79_02801 [Caballeronia hypogeia]
MTIVAQKQEALDLAAQLYPVAQIRVIDDDPSAYEKTLLERRRANR